jgi:RNA polymerase sigma factor (TIGR02999 family)
VTKESPDSAASPSLDFESWCPPELRQAAEQLMPVLYQDLRKMAHRERFKLSGNPTLTTTALVHESYLRMAGNPAFSSHAQFLKIATIVMRRVLVDRVRHQLAQKRGGGAAHVELEEGDGFVVEDDEQVLAIHEALGRLAQVSPRLADVVQCRYFGGYEDKEIAEALGITERTVRRDWVLAKAWLTRELGTV